MLKFVTCAAAMASVCILPQTVAAQNALSFSSADKAFSIAPKGVVQVDMGTYNQSSGLPAAIPAEARNLQDGSNLRRARLGVSGKLFSDFDYAVGFDFGGSSSDDKGRVFEAWTQYKITDSLKIRGGLFAPNVGLSDAGSSSAGPFMERGGVADLARSVAGGDTRMGVVMTGTTGRGFYNVGLTGSTLGKADSKGQTAVIARAAFLPLSSENRLIHLGVNGQFVLTAPDKNVRLRERTELRVDETRLIDAGAMAAEGLSVYGLEFGAQQGALFVQAEIYRFALDRESPLAGQTDPRFTGGYIEGGWVITGEKRKYNKSNAAFDGVKPARPFNPAAGDWGAWELTARYSQLDLNWHDTATVAADRVRGGEQTVMAIGVGWTLTSNLRIVAQAQDVDIERRNAAGDDMGQNYSSFAVRTQVNF